MKRTLFDDSLMTMSQLKVKLELLAVFIQRDDLNQARVMANEIVDEYDR